ncbi:MAG TPA: hypothetical protein VG986_09990 [Pseudolabrys sp.]|nr:hypothetical protein [Pseudolabrys sp.]
MRTLVRDWDDGTVKRYVERVSRNQESIPPSIAVHFQNLDTKASGLLTHVSMMIAGLGLIAPLVANHQFEEAVIVFEMTVYLLLAVACLRCLTVFNPDEPDDNSIFSMDVLGRELVLRRELYRVSIRVAIVFTMIVVVTLPAFYIW